MAALLLLLLTTLAVIHWCLEPLLIVWQSPFQLRGLPLLLLALAIWLLAGADAE